ncbi:unnamed protein product, partial [Staurois parvus]
MIPYCPGPHELSVRPCLDNYTSTRDFFSSSLSAVIVHTADDLNVNKAM